MRTRTSCAAGVGIGEVIWEMDSTPAPAEGSMKEALVVGGVDIMGLVSDVGG